MLGLAALTVPGFVIDGFWAALFGAVIISLTGMLANWFIGPRGYVEILVVQARTCMRFFATGNWGLPSSFLVTSGRD